MLAAVRSKTAEGSEQPMEQLVYSDGLASVSVFIEPGVAAAEQAEGRSRIGAANAYTTTMEGRLITAVGEVPGKHLINLQKPWRRIRALAGLDDVRIHDLRHSFASFAVGAGLSLPIIGGLLGHKSVQTTARYAHLAHDPLKQASDLVGTVITAGK